MKFYTTIFVTLLTLCSFALNAADRFVSDQLFTYMHSGPSAQFRIIGSINAGTAITLVQGATSGYSKIKDSKGRIGWIEAKFITKTMPSSMRLPQVVKELSITRKKLASIAATNEQSLTNQNQKLSNQIKTNDQLNSQRQQLLDKIQALEVNNQKLQARISNQSEEEERQWLIKGGIVIAAGIFIGLVVPHLPRRKKKNDQWS